MSCIKSKKISKLDSSMIIGRGEDWSITIPHDGSFAKKDRISELTDDIRIAILSLLGMKDAARTSVLSRIWRYSWTYNLDDLDFDARTTLGLGCHVDGYTALKFVSWVDQVIKAHSAPMVKKFRICHNLNGTHALFINRCLNFCLRKGVQELELDSTGNEGDYDPNPFTFETMWQTTSLNRDVCMTPTFTNLISFCVVGIRISASVLEFMLSNCLVLERLCLKSCIVLGGLKVVGSSLKLKYLKILTTAVDKLEVSAPNLITIECHSINGGHLTHIEYKNVPSLVDATFDGFKAKDLVEQISRYSFQLERLSIATDWESLRSIAIPRLYNLKQLTFEVLADDDGGDLLYLTYWLDACPLLREFKLELRRDFGESYESWRDSAIIYRCLEDVQIHGVNGQKGEYRFLSYLSKHAPVLKKVTLDTRDVIALRISMATGREYRYPHEKVERISLSKERLAKHFPSSVEVVII